MNKVELKRKLKTKEQGCTEGARVPIELAQLAMEIKEQTAINSYEAMRVILQCVDRSLLETHIKMLAEINHERITIRNRERIRQAKYKKQG